MRLTTEVTLSPNQFAGFLYEVMTIVVVGHAAMRASIADRPRGAVAVV